MDDAILNFLEDEPDILRRRGLQTDPKMRDVKIHHLLTHTIGLKKGYLFEGDRYSLPQTVCFLPSRRLRFRGEYLVGSVFTLV